MSQTYPPKCSFLRPTQNSKWYKSYVYSPIQCKQYNDSRQVVPRHEHRESEGEHHRRCYTHVYRHYLCTNIILLHTYIHKLTPFSQRGRNYRTPPATILTYSSCLVYTHSGWAIDCNTACRWFETRTKQTLYCLQVVVPGLASMFVNDTGQIHREKKSIKKKKHHHACDPLRVRRCT